MTTSTAPASGVVPGPRPAPPRTQPRPARPGPPPKPGQAPRPALAVRTSAPAVQLLPAKARQAVERADEAVDLLLESGRRPEDVLVLTVGEPHPWQQHEQSFGEERYWAQFAEAADVFYADVFHADAAAARRVGREVVVLVVNDEAPNRVERAARTALDQAGALLVVCGEPDLVAPYLPVPA